jgi:hypothetical protein
MRSRLATRAGSTIAELPAALDLYFEAGGCGAHCQGGEERELRNGSAGCFMHTVRPRHDSVTSGKEPNCFPLLKFEL